jgi:hypothetical protein
VEKSEEKESEEGRRRREGRKCERNLTSPRKGEVGNVREISNRRFAKLVAIAESG